MSEHRPLISIVIPVFDQWSLTRTCLESLRKEESGDSYEVIVVDNGSSDETPTECPLVGQSLFGDRFTYAPQATNLGFSKGINAGVAISSGRYVFLLNNDTVITGEMLSPLVAALQADPGLGTVGPLLLYPGSQRVQHLGVAVAHFHKFVHLYHMFPAEHDVVLKSRPLQAITGAAMMIERELFNSLGGLDGGFTNGMEDLDLCARMKSQGLGCAVISTVQMEHHVGQSATRHHAETANNRLYEQKQAGVLTPDMDALAAADGYQLRFTPWLDPYLEPGPDRLAAVEHEFERLDDPMGVLALLDREPCWGAGYDLLAGRLEQNGDLDAALGVRLRQSAFLPLPVVENEIGRLAESTGNQDALLRIQLHRESVESAMRHAPEAEAQARHLMEWSRQNGNTQLSGIMKQWFISRAKRS